MKRFLAVVATAACAGVANIAHAQLTMPVGNNWNFTLSGNVNGFYVEQWGPTKTPYIFGSAVDNVAGTTSNIRTGLLPADINFAAKGHEDGLDIGVFFGFYPEIQNGGIGSNVHDQFGALVDMRQVYLTIGNAKWGQIEVGRDLGLFNRENLLNDATLFGVGATGGNTGVGGTSLGRMGFGYIYPNFESQITYSTPTGKSLQWSIGVFQPSAVGSGSSVGILDSARSFAYTPLPRVESELTWTCMRGSNKALLWVNGSWENARSAPAGDTTAIVVNAGGLGAGGKFDMGSRLSVVGSGYWGRAIGTTLQFGPISTDYDGTARTSYGYVAQATYKVNQKWSVVGSYGESFITGTTLDQTLDPGYQYLLKYNALAVGSVVYQVTKSVKWVGEYGYDQAASTANLKDISNSLSTGFMLFF